MVNFGGHVKAVGEEENKSSTRYLVPYDEVKQMAVPVSSEVDDANKQRSLFVDAWTKSLQLASDDLTAASVSLWQDIIDRVHEKVTNEGERERVRGIRLSAATSLYVTTASNSREESQLLLTRMTHIHTAALTNSEALRKLVKKYDKNHHPSVVSGGEGALSRSLLPLLYASNLLGGQAVLLDSIEIVRFEMMDQPDISNDGEVSEDDTEFLPLVHRDSSFLQKKTIAGRIEELEWLKRLVSHIPTHHMDCLVAHRGFHHIHDRNDKRPLENSLSAYETAWTSGIRLCECDIALTKDGKLVLAHDDDFQRLALDARWENSFKRVSDLTFRELISMPLKSGLRVPLLIDVLRSAHAISDHAKLVIEVKPGNQAAASALARMLWNHMDLAQSVEMIMSFDTVTMHRLRTEFAALEQKAAVLRNSGNRVFRTSITVMLRRALYHSEGIAHLNRWITLELCCMLYHPTFPNDQCQLA